MNSEEIIEMAIEAEFVSHGKPSDEESELFVCLDKDIYKFAYLVAQKVRDKIMFGSRDDWVLAEREACAKVCEEIAQESDAFTESILRATATQIRARGES